MYALERETTMKTTTNKPGIRKIALAMTALAAAMAAGRAAADIKYWDNPAYKAYDVGDYVQDGLVVNYDGIRNAGADVAHSSSAMTWKNLGSRGASYDMTRYSLNVAPGVTNWVNDATKGSWAGNGFVANGKSIFHMVDQPFTLPESYSVQTLIDATSSGQGGNIGYVICPYYDNTVSGTDSTIQDG